MQLVALLFLQLLLLTHPWRGRMTPLNWPRMLNLGCSTSSEQAPQLTAPCEPPLIAAWCAFVFVHMARHPHLMDQLLEYLRTIVKAAAIYQPSALLNYIPAASSCKSTTALRCNCPGCVDHSDVSKNSQPILCQLPLTPLTECRLLFSLPSWSLLGSPRQPCPHLPAKPLPCRCTQAMPAFAWTFNSDAVSS